MPNTALITSKSNGKTFLMRIVRHGGVYGRDMCLTHDKASPLIEFYDTDHKFESDEYGDILGQFVSRYYVGGVIADDSRGLNLYGGEPAWQIDAQGMRDARKIMCGWMGL